jgi:hypothetical protein
MWILTGQRSRLWKSRRTTIQGALPATDKRMYGQQQKGSPLQDLDDYLVPCSVEWDKTQRVYLKPFCSCRHTYWSPQQVFGVKLSTIIRCGVARTKRCVNSAPAIQADDGIYILLKENETFTRTAQACKADRRGTTAEKSSTEAAVLPLVLTVVAAILTHTASRVNKILQI